MKYEFPTYPKKGRSLFVSTGEPYELANIGQGDMLAQFYDYTKSYLYSVFHLIESSVDDSKLAHLPQEIREQHVQLKLDECAMPVCFLFRQYLELTLKGIYFDYSLASPDELQSMIKDVGHDLLKAWKYAKPIIESVLEEKDKCYFDAFENYIIQFQNNDKTSMKYRYPTDRSLNLHISEEKLNLFNLKKRMDEIEYFLVMCILPHLDIEKIKTISSNDRNIALKLWDENKLDEAIVCYLNVLQEKQNFVGENHFDVLIANTEIGIIYLQNEQMKEALVHFKKSIEIYDVLKNHDSAKHHDISIVLNFVGLIYKTASKYDEAIKYYTQAAKFVTADISQQIIAYEGIARVYKRLEDTNKATENYDIALRLAIQNYGSEHEKALSIIAESSDMKNSKVVNI